MESKLDVENILKKQNAFFESGLTRSYEFRMRSLQALRLMIQKYEEKLCEALFQDLGKSAEEAYATEIGFVLSSITFFEKNLKKLMKVEKKKRELSLFPSKSFIIKEPLGSVLIISPFNYPVQLIFEPLIGAIAAGNCAVLKPSEHTPAVARVIEQMIKETFNLEFVEIIQGGKDETALLINAKFDFIFFTGSVEVGKIVMEAASKNLVPVCLELGGKSPVIVDRSADLDMVAKQIVWGKFVNVGQTCIAPDYVFVASEVKDIFISKMKETIKSFYGDDASCAKEYGRIVSLREYNRLVMMMERDKECLAFGGRVKKDERYIEPALFDLDPKKIESYATMKTEIFGPLLPIVAFEEIEQVINYVSRGEKPLALYLFTKDKHVEDKVLSNISFGSGGINNMLTQISSHHLPFGGVGSSGMGAYHGKYSFDLFSHQKAVVKNRWNFTSSELLYPPFKKQIKWIRKILK